MKLGVAFPQTEIGKDPIAIRDYAQAAEVDVLTRGRLRLGVGIGIGWNAVEFEALGESFRNRGRRVEEQVALLRQLWTNELVDFDGRYHTVNGAGINPLPVQRPIPMWMGGTAERVLQRIARVADGWFPQFAPGLESAETIGRLRGYVREAGRKHEDVGLEWRIRMMRIPEDGWGAALEGWRELGASHVSFNTMDAGLPSPQGHIDATGGSSRSLGAEASLALRSTSGRDAAASGGRGRGRSLTTLRTPQRRRIPQPAGEG